MSGNFWKSSHFQQWLLDPQDIILTRLKDLQLHNLKEDEYYKLMIFFTNLIQAVGEQLKLRQQVIASATVYFRRFYSKYSLKSIDPFLLAPTCLFLATKVEEFGLHSQQRFTAMTGGVLKAKYSHIYPQEYPYKIQHIWECEFYLLEVMDCCLILYHPYRPLIQFISDLCPDDTNLLQTAWRVVNDSLRTDICLMYPPSLIALACLHISCVIQKKDCKLWFSELNVDMEKIFEITKHILYLYDIWKSYDEKDQMKEIFSKLVKPKTSSGSGSSSAGASSSSAGASGSQTSSSGTSSSSGGGAQNQPPVRGGPQAHPNEPHMQPHPSSTQHHHPQQQQQPHPNNNMHQQQMKTNAAGGPAGNFNSGNSFGGFH